MLLTLIVGVLCAATIALHMALLRSWRPPEPPPQPELWDEKATDDGILRASKWSRRLTWWPPPNGSDSWLPEFGGLCGNRLPNGCTPLTRAHDCDAVACLPNLFLIGASKAGTTTLHNAMTAHPSVHAMFAEPFTNGETHVFTERKTTRDYVLRMARRSPPMERDLPDDFYVVEYTPHYLVLPDVALRVCDTLGAAGVDCRNAKFVVMLRDPAKRAFSQYVMKTHMRVPRYNDQRSFEEAMQAGMQRTRRYARCWDDGLKRNVTLDNIQRVRNVILGLADTKCAPQKFDPNLFQAYVLKSAYYYQLLPWLAAVPNLLVLVLERFKPSELKRLFAFLGLPFVDMQTGYPSMLKVRKLVHTRKNAARDGGEARIGPKHKATLDNFFRPANRKLDALIRPLLDQPTTGYPV